MNFKSRRIRTRAHHLSIKTNNAACGESCLVQTWFACRDSRQAIAQLSAYSGAMWWCVERHSLAFCHLPDKLANCLQCRWRWMGSLGVRRSVKEFWVLFVCFPAVHVLSRLVVCVQCNHTKSSLGRERVEPFREDDLELAISLGSIGVLRGHSHTQLALIISAH